VSINIVACTSRAFKVFMVAHGEEVDHMSL